MSNRQSIVDLSHRHTKMAMVLGLTGRICSGKGVVAKYLLDNYDARIYRFSKILMDILDRLYLPHDRKYLQGLGVSLRESLSSDVIVNTLKKDIERDMTEYAERGYGNKLIVIDGIRYPDEVEMLKELDNNILITLTAPPKMRYGRCKERGEKGEGNISFDDFLVSENRGTERQLDRIGELADYMLENTGTIDVLFKAIDEILKRHKIKAY